MYFIGLDPSTNFGVAKINMSYGIDKPVFPCLVESDVFIEKENLDGVARALNITDQVLDWLPPPAECFVVVEGYSFASTQRIVTLVEIGTILRYQLLKCGYIFRLCPPSNLKKFVTGKGNSDKKRMILDAHKRWGFDLSDDNECDAACLAVMGAAFMDQYKPPKLMIEEAKKLLVCS